MCSYIVEKAKLLGSAKGPSGWMRIDTANVYYDHPFHAPLDHALGIDLISEADGGRERVAVELSAASARELVVKILAALATGEVEHGKAVHHAAAPVPAEWKVRLETPDSCGGAAMTVMTRSRFDVVPLSQHIGAEIRGLDLREKPDDDVIRAVYQAWLDHLVIIFPGQKLSQEDLLRATGYFGELGELSRPPKYFPKGYSSLLPGIMMISNIRENGEPIGALPDGEMMFHHDMIHAEVPSKATLLYSVEIPSTGGNTLFASGYAAYDTLDPAIRDRLEGRKAMHHYNYGSTQKCDSRGTVAFAECTHPVFRTHEDTGRKAVYVNRLMTMGILDMPPAESEPLLNAVFDHAEKREFVYEHVWRVGDLLLWDNRCSSHARTDFPSSERRLMLRTTVKGTVRPY